MVKIIKAPRARITNVPRVKSTIGKRLNRPPKPFMNDFKFSILEE